jgi:hypothetical protein
MDNYACYKRRIHYCEIITSTFNSNLPSITMVLFEFLDDNQERIRHILLIVLLIHLHNTIRNRHYLLCRAIVPPSKSPWRKLYDHADELSFLHITGLNCHAFAMLMEHVFDMEAILARRHRGHPCLLGPEGYLGLLLFYLGSTMNTKHLCPIFGIMPLVCSCGIHQMLKKIVHALTDHPFAQVKFPNGEKMREYAAMVEVREPVVNDITVGFMDGVSFPTECTDERVEQNLMYCGYDCNTMVNNVFAYGPDGKVFLLRSTFLVVGQMEV